MKGATMRLLPLVLSLLLPTMAIAATGDPASQPTGPTHFTYPKRSYLTLLNDIALNAAAGTRTFSLTDAQVSGMAFLKITVKRTRVAGTNLTMTCTQSPDGGTTKADIDTCEYTAGSGVCTHFPIIWTDPNSSSQAQTWEVPLLGYGSIECLVASSSAGASDKLTLLGRLVTQ